MSRHRVRYVKLQQLDKLIAEMIRVARPELKPEYVKGVVAIGSRSGAAAYVVGTERAVRVAHGLPPLYTIVVIAERLANLTPPQILELLTHELAHIPSTMSGSLIPHNKTFERKMDEMRKRIEPHAPRLEKLASKLKAAVKN